MPRLADSVAYAAKSLNDPRFYDLLFTITQSKGLSSKWKLFIRNLLINVKYPRALADWEKIFRKVVKKIKAGDVRCEPMEIRTAVKTICRLQIRSMVDALGELLIVSNTFRERGRYFLDNETYCYLRTTVTWFEDGVRPLRQIIINSSVDTDYRASAIFTLGCAQDKEFCEKLKEVYFACSEYNIRLACVEAIVYMSSNAESLDFLTTALEKAKERRLLPWRGCPLSELDVSVVFNALFVMNSINDKLVALALPWLDCRNTLTASMAWVALEKHGVSITTKTKLFSQSLSTVRDSLRSSASVLGLMEFRDDRKSSETTNNWPG
jgi:hypothetical protein